MASTYSPNLRLELIGTGEQQGTWGSTTNVNLGTLIEEAIGGYVSVTVSDVADTTLTANNGTADQSRNMVINLTGTLTGSRNVICPAVEKLYVVKNATSGGFAVTFKVSGQTGVSVPSGSTVFVYVDSVDARSITGSIASQSSSNVAITGGTISGVTISSITDLAVADGGTGASDASTARTNLGVAIGTNVQAYDATLQSLSALGTAADKYAYTTGVDTWAEGSITAAGRAILDDADASAQRTTLGLGSAATLNVGTSANNVVQLDGTAKLPAVDGSQLTNIPVPASSGRLLRAPQILTSGTSYTTPAGCNTLYVEAVGGGGAGGSGSSGPDVFDAGCGAGGGAGGYAAKYFSVSPSTAYSYAIGAGGAASSGNGGNTTFTVGVVTLSGNGGGGGEGGDDNSSGDGGAGGTGTNGDINVMGGGGGGGISTSGGTNSIRAVSGAGGCSFFGGGGRSREAQNAGVAGASGGGGSGGSSTNANTVSGGAGGAGLIRIWEYS